MGRDRRVRMEERIQHRRWDTMDEVGDDRVEEVGAQWIGQWTGAA